MIYIVCRAKFFLYLPWPTEANGLVEHYSQTLQNMLVKYASNLREEWDVYLDTCVYAYNTSVQESTHYSPFKIMFGPTMPIDIDMGAESPEDRLQKCIQDEELSPSKVKERAAQQCELRRPRTTCQPQCLYDWWKSYQRGLLRNVKGGKMDA